MPSYLRQQKPHFGSLRKDAHWSTEGLVYYPNFSPAGKLRDLTQNRNDGTIIGPVWSGASLLFNGSSDYVTVPDDTTLQLRTTGFLTVSVWVKRASLGSQHLMFTKGFLVGGAGSFDGYSMEWGTDNKLTIRVNGSTQNITAREDGISGADLLWHNCVMVLQLGSGKLMFGYVDGREVINRSFDETDMLTSGDVFNIGTNGDASGGFLGGMITDVKAYNHDLSLAAIQALYNNPNLPIQTYNPYGFVSGAPTGFKPYWAVNNNILIGAA